MWPWRLSVAGLVSFFACIAAFVGVVLVSNGALSLSRWAGIEAAAIPLVAIGALGAVAYCATFPLTLCNVRDARREAQALGLGIACVCGAIFALTI